MPRRCPVCKSSKWHRDPLSGLIVCSEGHVLQNYRNETNETTELGQFTLRKRKLKSQRQKKERISKADPKLYHGNRAKFHYLQCLQLLFRKQVVALIEAWALPPEFESICRDTWALHLTLLPEDIPAEPLLDRSSDREAHDIPGIHPVEQAGGKEEEEESDIPSSPASSTSSSSIKLDDENADFRALLEEASQTSESSDAEGSPSKGRAPAPKRKSRRRPTHAKPAASIVVLVISCWILRVPVIYQDFVQLVERYTLPYLAPLHHLPPEMSRHLTKYTTQALSPSFPPSCSELHRLAARFARRLQANYRILVPEMNPAPILWRAVRALNGSPTLYTLTKSLARTLDVTLTLHPSLSSALRGGAHGPRSHKMDVVAAEVALVSCVVLVLKMIYGLDGVQRQPADSQDPLCLMPQMGEWLKSLRSSKTQKAGKIISSPSDMSGLEMSDEELDRYINFCQLALVDTRDESLQNESDSMLKSFPLPSFVDTVEQTPEDFAPFTEFQAVRVSPDADIRPATRHTIYSSIDVGGSLPEQYELVLSVAASWTGVDVDDVGAVVESFERQLVQWWKTVQKEQRRSNQEKGKAGAKSKST